MVSTTRANRLFTDPLLKPPPFVSKYLVISTHVERRVVHPEGLVSDDDFHSDLTRQASERDTLVI